MSVTPSYSSSVGQTTFNTRRLIDRASARAGRPAEQLSAEDLDIAKDELYLLLFGLANDGVPLWCIEKNIYPLYEGVPEVFTYAGVVDVLNANIRTLAEITTTATASSTQVVLDAGEAVVATTIGVKWSATAVPLEIARSDDNILWDVVQTETPTVGSGEWSWFDLASAVSSQYIRVRATSGTLAYSEIFVGNTPSEIPMGVLNRDDYTALPNKTFQSERPLQYWLDAQAASPVMRVWPAPNAASEHRQIVAWVHRHIMDVGTLRQSIEVPQRWLDAIIASLAARLVVALPGTDLARAQLLDMKAAEATAFAKQGQSAGGPINLIPNISAYTR